MEAANTETPPASTVGVRALSAQTGRGCKFFYQHTNHRYNHDTGSNHRRNGTAHQTKASEILSTKPQDQQYLNWRDMQEVCLIVKSACVKQFNEVPQGVEMACYFAEAVLAPDKKAKLKLIKQVISLTSGTAGITIILAGVGAALGWGAGIVTTVTAFFLGTSMLGPIAAMAGGTMLAVIAGYFIFDNDAPTLSNKSIDALRKGIRGALAEYWKEHGKKLAE